MTDETSAEHVLFESAAICEFLDETTPLPLMPADPLAASTCTKRRRSVFLFAAKDGASGAA